VIAILAAHNEADRIGATLAALGEAFGRISIWVADDGSSDGTAGLAVAAGAQVVRSERRIGKGGAMTRAAHAALATAAPDELVLLCDADLGESAACLEGLAEAVLSGAESGGGDADLAVAVFSWRAGGGLGIAIRSARWSIDRRCGLATKAPLSGQRALRARSLSQVLPFAAGYGMEVGMTIDAVRAGMRVREIELDLSHRASGRTPAGFAHRGRQLLDVARAYAARR
jgi:glycosyltransferase involved in cell wall biosynthesis